jgi:hypothetical protein
MERLSKYMKRTIRTLIATTILAGGIGAHGQEKPAAQPQVNPRNFPGQVATKVEAGPRIHLEFPGGTPRELLQHIEMGTHAKANVIIHPECKNVVVPPIELHEVTVGQIFMALNAVAEPEYKDGIWRRVPEAETEIWTLVRPAPQASSAGQMLTQMQNAGSFQERVNRLVNAPRGKTCKVFNLSRALEAYSIDDVTTTIQAGWELLAKDTNRDMKFHKETKLLIVLGDDADINFVADVIRELSENAPGKKKSAQVEKGAEVGKTETPKAEPKKQ